MRISIRSAISILVLLSILVTAAGVNTLWWRTADDTSRTLAATINAQIVSAVEDELQSVTTEAKSAFIAVEILLRKRAIDSSNKRQRQLVFLSQLQAQPTISWVALGWSDGSLSAAHKLGDSTVEMLEIAGSGGDMQVARYDSGGSDLQLQSTTTEKTAYRATSQEWYRAVVDEGTFHWTASVTHPGGEQPAVAYSGPIADIGDGKGVLAIIIELTRVSQFLSQLTFGKSAGAFILDRDGRPLALPDGNADEVHPLRSDHPFLPAATQAIRTAGTSYEWGKAEPYRTRVSDSDGGSYAVVLTPISFPGWTVATVVPESEFLGPVQTTLRHLLLALAALIVAAGVASAWLAQRLIARPLEKVVGEIKTVERFDLDRVKRHPSRIAELENLSSAIADMAGGLAAFRKYIPEDLVRQLIGAGISPQPGGSSLPMSVLFTDVAGFTGLSERLGDAVFPLLSRYLDAMSGAIVAHGGTIDKFIGDAAMAFWGAPSANPDHVLDACRAALACQRSLREAAIVDDHGVPLVVRIGVNSGDMLVGNVGSQARLNYTVVGDAVNVASRLEALNKSYGTSILIGPHTRTLAGDRIWVREVDVLAVRGRDGGLHVYELLGMADDLPELPQWVSLYEAGVAALRRGDAVAAQKSFRDVLAIRADGASEVMLARCVGSAVKALPANGSREAISVASDGEAP